LQEVATSGLGLTASNEKSNVGMFRIISSGLLVVVEELADGLVADVEEDIVVLELPSVVFDKEAVDPCSIFATVATTDNNIIMPNSLTHSFKITNDAFPIILWQMVNILGCMSGSYLKEENINTFFIEI
jgi:hypothetical protein